MTSKTSVKAKVRITLEIDVGSTWGGECNMDQIHKQASDEAKLFIVQEFTTKRMVVKMVGTPEIDAIIYTRRD